MLDIAAGPRPAGGPARRRGDRRALRPTTTSTSSSSPARRSRAASTRPVTASHAVRLGMLPPSRLDAVLASRARARASASSRCRSPTSTCRAATPPTPPRAGSRRCARSSTRASRSPRARTTCATPSTPRAAPTRSRRPAAADRGPPHRRAGPARRHRGRPRRARPARGRVAPGDVADLMLVPDVDLGDVLAGAEDARIVLSGGRVVADTRVQRCGPACEASMTAPDHPTADPRPRRRGQALRDRHRRARPTSASG